MIFSYNWLQDYIKGKLPQPEKLAELLTFHSFEVESVVKKGTDWVLDIDVLPNRAPDCLSHIGIARESAALTNSKFQAPSSKTAEEKKLKAKDFVEVEVENKEDCFRYTARVVIGVKIKSSPKRIQERLKVCGLQPINNVVDIANYVMLETGQPIHAFDLDKLAKKIIVRRAKKGENLEALDDKTYQLDKDILVIADTKEPIAIAGIKGGETTGIDKNTKNIVIEAANFNQKVIRQGSRKLRLKTDASWRFENGVDPNLIDFAQARICSLIQKVAGGKVAQGMVDLYAKKVLPKKIKLDLNYLEKLLGVKITEKKTKEILKNLGFRFRVSPKQSKLATPVVEQSSLRGTAEQAGFKLLVEVPTRRLDVSIPEDLIEEIGRIYGYENIPSTYPQTALIPAERNEDIFWERNVKNTLKETGFCEAYNYSFIGEKEKATFGWKENELIELDNPMSSFNKYLRPSLIPNLLRSVRENLKYLPAAAPPAGRASLAKAGFDEIKIFEVGKIFIKQQTTKNKKQNVLEKKMMGGALTRKGIKETGFYELKGVVDSLLNGLGLSNVWYDEYQQTPEESKLAHWHPGRCAEIKTDGEEIGFLGEINPKILEDFEIKEQVFIFDLDFGKLIKLASEEHEYRPISSYPASLRDLAILVPQGTKMVAVLNKINAAGGRLVRDVDLFDVYRGEGIPKGKENFAFHIIYQAEDKTLSSKEVEKTHQKIIKALEETPDWEVRR